MVADGAHRASHRLEKAFAAPTIFALTVIFIFYATSVPFDFSHAPTLANASLIPFWDTSRQRIHSIPDLVQNVALFMPFGFFGFLGLTKVRARGLLAGSALMAALGLALSLTVELLQTMSVLRQTSASDLATNSIGALVGGFLGGLYAFELERRIRQAIFRTVRSQPGMLIVAAFFAALVLALLAPFIPTLDVGMIRGQVRKIILDPLGTKTIGGVVADAVLFMGLGFVASYEVPSALAARKWLRADPQKIPAALGAGVSAILVSGLALVMEIAQLPLIHHSPGALEAAANMFGAACGAGLAFALSGGFFSPAKDLGELSRRWAPLAVAFAILAPTLRALDPFQFVSLEESVRELSWLDFLPFWKLFTNLKISTFINVFEAASIYVALGYVLRALGRRPLAAFAYAILLAEILEVLQIPVAGRTFDITEGILGATGALLGAFGYDRLKKMKESP